jgi:hypothetical protein
MASFLTMPIWAICAVALSWPALPVIAADLIWVLQNLSSNRAHHRGSAAG